MSHFIHYPFWCPSFSFHYFILTARLPYSQFFLWRKCLQQRCLWRKCQTWRWGVKMWGVWRSQGWGLQTSRAGGRTLTGCSLLRSMLEWQACRGKSQGSWLLGQLRTQHCSQEVGRAEWLGFQHFTPSVESGALWGNSTQLEPGRRFQSIPMKTTKIRTKRNSAGPARMTDTCIFLRSRGDKTEMKWVRMTWPGLGIWTARKAGKPWAAVTRPISTAWPRVGGCAFSPAPPNACTHLPQFPHLWDGTNPSLEGCGVHEATRTYYWSLQSLTQDLELTSGRRASGCLQEVLWLPLEYFLPQSTCRPGLKCQRLGAFTEHQIPVWPQKVNQIWIRCLRSKAELDVTPASHRLVERGIQTNKWWHHIVVLLSIFKKCKPWPFGSRFKPQGLEPRSVNKVSDPVGKFWQTWVQALEPDLGSPHPGWSNALTFLGLSLLSCEVGHHGDLGLVAKRTRD